MQRIKKSDDNKEVLTITTMQSAEDREQLFSNQPTQQSQEPPRSQELKEGAIILTADKGLLVGPKNTLVTCPYCKANIKTTVDYTTTTRTHMAAVLFHLICCCCCIPYCSTSAKNADHYCPNCQHYLGTYQR